jgi:hypothetical protein
VKLLRLAPLLAPLLVSVLVLAGCGGGGSSSNGVADKSADEIVADATAAVKEAESVHVQGGTGGDGSIELDIYLVRDEGGEGTLTANGVSFEMIRIGDKAYFKGDDAFWQQFGGDAAASLMRGRWLVAPANSGDLASFTPLTDIDQLFGELLGNHGEPLEKGDETEVDGEPAIEVNDPSEGGKLYVATEGEPYPVKVEMTGEEGGAITFSEWDEEHELEAPEDPVDVAELTGG